MKLYLIRHGVSEMGEEYHQTAETPLSSIGINQAQVLAHRFQSISLDVLISSPYKRALQTAEEIKKTQTISITESNLFIERKMPSSFLGNLVKDPHRYAELQTIRDHFYEPNWHFADEENFTDLTNRAKKALEFIQSENGKHVAVVTHGYFILVLTYVILMGTGEYDKSFQSFRKHMKNSNGGVTTFQYEDGIWKLLTWNDTQHLKK